MFINHIWNAIGVMVGFYGPAQHIPQTRVDAVENAMFQRGQLRKRANVIDLTDAEERAFDDYTAICKRSRNLPLGEQ
jgi:hypothetical protein